MYYCFPSANISFGDSVTALSQPEFLKGTASHNKSINSDRLFTTAWTCLYSQCGCWSNKLAGWVGADGTMDGKKKSANERTVDV